MGFLTILLPILGSIFSNGKGGIVDIIGDFFKKKADIAQAQVNLQLEQLKSTTELAKQGLIAESNKNIEQLKSTSGRFKELVFLVFLSPVIIACFSPMHGKAIFDAMGLVPEWYMFLITTTYLAMWGITNSKVQDMIQTSRDYRLQKKLIKAGIDRKEFFDAYRAVKGSALSEQEVQFTDRIIDKLEEEK